MDDPTATGGGGSAASGGLSVALPPPFLCKTYDIVDDPSTDAVVSWGSAGNSFVVWDPPGFTKDLLPKHFKHSNFSSFVRQLNTYGFRKVDPDRWEFANEGFLKGHKHLLKNIRRRKPAHGHSQVHQPQAQNPSVASCVEVGKFGIKEEIEGLKRDKNVLMQELVRLRQQQQSTDQQLQTLGKRLRGMEQRQKQMLSFLVKAMQNPGFLAQLVQQNDSKRHIAGGKKKRRLPGHEGSLEAESAPSLDGQIVKYQPLINEAAKAMLMQLLKFNTSSRLESLSNSDGLLLEDIPCPETLDGNSSSGNSGVAIAKVPPTSGIPNKVPTNSGFSADHSSSTITGEIRSLAGETDIVSTLESPDIGMLFAIPVAIPSDATQMQGIVHDGNVPKFSCEDLVGHEADAMCTNDTAAMPVEKLPSDIDISLFNDEESPKLPDIVDPFWEQFAASLLSGDSCLHEAERQQPAEELGWDSAGNMDNLTEQMGLLASNPQW